MEREQKTFCRICDVCCGMIATVRDDRIVRLRPNPDHVVSRGFACPKGLAYREIVHSPDRVTAPLRRRGSLNDPESWTAESWANAFADIGGRLRRIIDESGPDSVALYVGNGAGFAFLHPFWAQGFLMGIGSASLYGSATQDCSNKFAVAQAMYGFPMLQPVPDFEHAEFFIVLGANPAATKFSFRGVPGVTSAFRRIAERGGRVVHVNPRRTETVDAGGEHLPIRPDTDVFFLAAFARELFEIGAVDEMRVSAHMTGRDDLWSAVREWTPERQAEATGISADGLRNLAADFAAADGASMYLSTGLNMGRRGSLCGWLVEAINAVSGNLDRSGGTLVGKGSLMDFPALGSRVGAMMGEKTSRLGGHRAVNELLPGSLLADEILTPGPGRIRALITAAGNPLLTLPDTAKTIRAFRELDLLVSVDIFRSATGDYADWILPGITPYEHPDIGYIFHSMAGIGHRRFLQYTDAVLPPRGDAKDEPWIWQELCRAAGGRFYGSRAVQSYLNLRRSLSRLPGRLGRPFAYSHERILNRFLKMFRRIGLRRMRRHPDGLLLPEPPPGSFLGRRVRTPDGRVHLAPERFVAAAADLAEDFEGERSRSNGLKLVNMRGFRTQNSYLQNSPTLMKGSFATNHLHIHPADAEIRGLTDGAEALVWTDSGCIRVPVSVSDRMSPGSAAIPFGWGQQRTRGLSVARQTGGANVNWLIPSGEGHFEELSLMAHLSGIPIEAAPMPDRPIAVVLAGGQSRRFGSDKAFAHWRGRPLLDHVLQAVEDAGLAPILSVSDPAPFADYTHPRLADPDPSIRSPLGGLLAAARTLPGSFLVVTADAPAVPPAVLERLADHLDSAGGPVVFGDEETLHPFPGVYRPEHLDAFEEAYHGRRYRITELLRTMEPRLLSFEELRRADPAMTSLRNVNTPEDLDNLVDPSPAAG